MNSLKSCNFIKMLIIMMGIFSFEIKAQSPLLDSQKEAWLKSRNALESIKNQSKYNLEDIIIKNQLLNLEYDARSQYLRTSSKEYLNGNFKVSEFKSEVAGFYDSDKIMNQLSTEILATSLGRLKLSTIPQVRELFKKYNQTYSEGLPLFKLTGAEINRSSPTEEKGGFHRGNNSIFMDIERTGRSEWLFILIHELFHALDNELYQATMTFSNKDLFESILKISNEKTNYVEISSKENNQIEQWVVAGLNRGLFAEFRAWVFGFSIYEDGIKEGLWGRIPFVDQVLFFKDENESMKSFVYRYLSERSKMPSEGILARPIILQKIEEKKEEFRRTLN